MHARTKIVVALGCAALGTAVLAGAEELGATASEADGPPGLVIREGFEESVPPPSWELITSTAERAGTSQTWNQYAPFPSIDGNWAAEVEYDPAYYPAQDEWLLTPVMELGGPKAWLSFRSGGSVYWCKEPCDNCHLEVWLVVGELDYGVPGGDDIFLGRAEDDWATSWVWQPSKFDLSPYLPMTVRIGFRYWGIDGAQVVLDRVRVFDQSYIHDDGVEGNLRFWSSVVGGPDETWPEPPPDPVDVSCGKAPAGARSLQSAGAADRGF